jgi:hypothetical protein
MNMKRIALATLIALAPLTLRAQSTDAMPPEAKAPMAGMHETAKAPVPPSRSVALSFEGKSISLSLTDLANMPQTTIHVRNGHTNADETYSGPLLSDVLAKIGLVSNAETHSLILHSTIVATGSDHYFVLYSGAEAQPDFSTGKVIVAVMKSGLPDQEGGLIQLINTTDAKPARWVHGLSSLSVMTLAPQK